MKQILGILVVLMVSNFHAQDPFFINTNQSLVSLNPSFAGSNGGIRNQASYRNQNLNSNLNYVTFSNSFDVYLKPLRGGLALSYFRDDASHGSLVSSFLGLNYAQHLNFVQGNLTVIPSFQLSYGTKNLNRDNLHFGDPMDSRYGFVWNSFEALPSTTRKYVNMNAGLLVNYKKDFYIGVAAFNINQPDIGMLGVQKLPYRLCVHTSYNLQANESVHLQAFFKYNYQDIYSYSQFSLNAIFKNHFIIGVGYLSKSTLTGLIGFKVGWFTLQSGYAIDLSSHGSAVNSWEGHVSINFPDKGKNKDHFNFENF